MTTYKDNGKRKKDKRYHSHHAPRDATVAITLRVMFRPSNGDQMPMNPGLDICHDCGCTIPPDLVRRRDVDLTPGTGSEIGASTLPSRQPPLRTEVRKLITRAHIERVKLCPTCDDKRATQQFLDGAKLLILMGIMVFGLLVFFFISTPAGRFLNPWR
jgi:hypothetical protein